MSDNRTHRFRPSKSIAEVPHINCLLCRACHFVCASEESRRTHLICPHNRAPRRFYRLLPRPILCRPYHLRRPCPLSLQIPQVNDLARPRRPAARDPPPRLHRLPAARRALPGILGASDTRPMDRIGTTLRALERRRAPHRPRAEAARVRAVVGLRLVLRQSKKLSRNVSGPGLAASRGLYRASTAMVRCSGRRLLALQLGKEARRGPAATASATLVSLQLHVAGAARC